MTLPCPRAVIFDWDDTVVDSWHIALKAMNAALTSMGESAWSDDEARRRAGPSARDIFLKLFNDRWHEADKIYYDTYERLIKGEMRLHDDIEEVLKALHARGVYLAVVSNKRGSLLRVEVGHAGFEKYFGRIVGAGDASVDKPDPAPVIMALEGSGILPGPDVWFIGDSHVDMICARNSGCTPVLIETKPPPEEVLAKNMPARRFPRHLELMEFIKTCFV